MSGMLFVCILGVCLFVCDDNIVKAFSPYRAVNRLRQLMLYWEIMAVCSQIHTKHINTVCGQNVELLNVKLAVHIVTTGLQRVKSLL